MIKQFVKKKTGLPEAGTGVQATERPYLQRPVNAGAGGKRQGFQRKFETERYKICCL